MKVNLNFKNNMTGDFFSGHIVTEKYQNVVRFVKKMKKLGYENTRIYLNGRIFNNNQ